MPFEAITAFYDPAVQFGFQFETIEAEAGGERPATGEAADKPPPMRIVPPESAKPDAKPVPSRMPSPSLARAPAPASEPARPSGGGEVVRLDRFRKK